MKLRSVLQGKVNEIFELFTIVSIFADKRPEKRIPKPENAMKCRDNTSANALVRAVRGVYRFYYDGFRQMTVGRTLWILILVKLFVIFAVLRLFFFSDILSRDYDTDEERADHVRKELTRRGCDEVRIHEENMLKTNNAYE